MKYSPKIKLLVNESEYLCGLLFRPLGASEQEHGIEPVQAAFKIGGNKTQPFSKRYVAAHCPENLVFTESKTDGMLIYEAGASKRYQTTKRKRPVTSGPYFPYGLSGAIPPSASDPGYVHGAWNQESFGLYATNTFTKHLKTLFLSAQQNDLALFCCDREFIKANHLDARLLHEDWLGSLCMIIPSRFPIECWPEDMSLIEAGESAVQG
jgi:hypothetical protein